MDAIVGKLQALQALNQIIDDVAKELQDIVVNEADFSMMSSLWLRLLHVLGSAHVIHEVSFQEYTFILF